MWMNSKRAYYIVTVVLAMLCIIFSCVGVFVGLEVSRERRECSVPSKAEVVDFVLQEKESKDSDGYIWIREYYYPVVSYETTEGEVRGVSEVGFNTKRCSLGDTLDIMYNSENVHDFYIVGESSFIFDIFFVGTGLVFGVACLIFSVVLKDKISWGMSRFDRN